MGDLFDASSASFIVIARTLLEKYTVMITESLNFFTYSSLLDFVKSSEDFAAVKTLHFVF